MGSLRSELKRVLGDQAHGTKGAKRGPTHEQVSAKSVIPAMSGTPSPSAGKAPVFKDPVRGTMSAQNPELPASSRPVTTASASNLKTPTVAALVVPVPTPVPATFTPLGRSGFTRKNIYKDPDDWVADGVSTQFEIRGTAAQVDVVIGLDFGTSYTKAAVGFMDKIYPVTWEGVSTSQPRYLLPSEYTVLSSGMTVIGQHPSATIAELHTDLKLPFLNPAVSNTSIARASIFIALVLKYVRAWLFFNHGDKLGGAGIRWQLNIGAPSNGLETKRLHASYRSLAGAAWAQSALHTEMGLEEAKEMVVGWQEGQVLKDLIDLTIFPEFVAQMAGYMQSPQRTLGLHSLIDVGGGTLDIVTFIVHSVDDEDVFPFLVPEVRPLGTHGLIQNRLLGVESFSSSQEPDELAPVGGPAEFAADTGLDPEHVASRDTMFAHAVGTLVQGVFAKTKSRRYRLSDAWKTGVRTFFTGGGASVPLYKDAIQSVPVQSAGGLQLMQLPPHPKLDGFDSGVAEYQRISVACGLAQDSFTLGRIVPAREVGDDRPPEVRPLDRPDRDELYPH